MRTDIFIVIAVLLLVSAAGCQGGGSSSGGAPGSPLSITIVNVACPAYELPNRHIADTSDFDAADKIKDNCTIVLTGWSAAPEQSWCPYLRDDSNVEYCGPYDNWGFISNVNDPDAWNVGGDIYNDYILPNHPEWILKDPNGETVSHTFGANESAPDHGNMDFVDFYFDYFMEVPASVAGGRWQGTYTERSWNLRFLDNYVVYAPEAWSASPVNPLTDSPVTREEREQHVLNAARRLRERADAEAGGLGYMVNVWSDVESGYFDRDIYPELMQYVDYALFEAWTSNGEGAPVSESVWLRRVMAAQDMIENRRAEPVVQVGFGDFWYALSSLLLVSENGKGMIWSNDMYSDTILSSLSALDLGSPLGVFTYVDNAYQREWEKGKVTVNPGDSITVNIALGRNYEDVVSGVISSSITLPPRTGKILLAR
jgi:hypothetical protein